MGTPSPLWEATFPRQGFPKFIRVETWSTHVVILSLLSAVDVMWAAVSSLWLPSNNELWPGVVIWNEPYLPKVTLVRALFYHSNRKETRTPFVFSASIKENMEAKGWPIHLPRINRDTEWTSQADSQVFQWMVTQYPPLSHCSFIVNTSFLTKSPKQEVILNQYIPKVSLWSREIAATLSGSSINT